MSLYNFEKYITHSYLSNTVSLTNVELTRIYAYFDIPLIFDFSISFFLFDLCFAYCVANAIILIVE